MVNLEAVSDIHRRSVKAGLQTAFRVGMNHLTSEARAAVMFEELQKLTEGSGAKVVLDRILVEDLEKLDEEEDDEEEDDLTPVQSAEHAQSLAKSKREARVRLEAEMQRRSNASS